MNEDTLQLFRTLTETPAAPGHERELRAFVESQLSQYTDELVHDRLGGVFGVFRGNEEGPRIMVAGHLDEVGFMVSSITDNGMLRFTPLGGWWNQTMMSQRVHVITKNGPIVGVIGSVPPHLLDEATRNKPMDMKHMHIDIGADSKDEVLGLGIRPGLPIVPICPFTPMANPKKIMAKAWDNRYGVGLAIELAKELGGQAKSAGGEAGSAETAGSTAAGSAAGGASAALPNVVYTGATVQEEVGLRGAKTAAALIHPDLFFALDASPANDASGDRNAMGQLGKGALLRILDRGMITHNGMVEYILDTASTHKIPYQYFISPGGTDAGEVHLNGIGVPSAVVGICSRYIHTAASIIHVDDYAAAKELLLKLVRGADRTTYETILSNR
ncbi:peptidase M28 [Paenibacillus swuensis]|uniref:Peptidase M28 n=1 Tax=Paenibacillus swuensis TaxID=1178515 RepID=A0A172TF10_9BACL|nr:M42 family metallopeptidase [Paenibacillus swuensis]ANE45639.1 peptidase M28 [Paenibacillus swuensis]